MISDTTSWLEAIWTAIAVFGTFVTVLNLYEAVLDLRAIAKVRPRNGRYAIARGAVRVEATRVITMVGFVAIGLYAMTRPNGPSGTSSIVGIIFVSISTLHVIGSILDAHLRQVIASYPSQKREKNRLT